MNPLKVIKYQLYLLQLENYDVWRFLRMGKRLFRPVYSFKKALVWTAKATTLLSLGIFFELLVAILVGSIFHTLGIQFFAAIVVFCLLSFFHFLFLFLALFLLWPFDYIFKQIIIGRAKSKIKKSSNLKIVGITGSYGKTTMKEVLATILSQKFIVLKTPENINTPLGVARLILQGLTPETEIFIVEMGAYRRGDIKTLCGIAKPDIGILTGINESHLERFGSLENTIQAKFEIVENTEDEGFLMLNADDDFVMQNYQTYLSGQRVFFFSSLNNKLAPYQIKKQNFFEDGSGQSFELVGQGTSLGEIKISLLGEYALGIVIACVVIAKELELTLEQVRKGIKELESIPHRLQILSNHNEIIVIDDSYNGNPNGVREAIKVLGKFRSKRKIYITPGLVEMGERVKEIHREIGQNLALVTDTVLLIKNSVTPFIAQGLKDAGFPQENLLWFDNAPAAYVALPKLLKRGDVILFQNDWPDNYL